MSQSSYSRPSSEGAPSRGLRRKYSLQLSLPAIISAVIIFVIGIGWVFAFGVIVGRGYNPEKKMPELASLLPPPSGQVQSPILKPEELTFMADLKQNPTLSKKQPESKPDRPEVKPGYKPEPPQAEAGKVAGKTVQNTPQVPKPVADSKKKHDFVLQVVAYKSSTQADALRERLEGEGLRTRMTIERDVRKRPKWYRVQILLRGTEADVVGIRTKLTHMGIKDISVTSQKAVANNR